MWETLPIQKSPGPPYTMIDREFTYPSDEAVRVSRWKDVPHQTRDWAFSIWKDTFHMQRNFMGDDDLLIWIPRMSTLVAKHGRWIGDEKSFHTVFTTFLAVSYRYNPFSALLTSGSPLWTYRFPRDGFRVMSRKLLQKHTLDSTQITWRGTGPSPIIIRQSCWTH